MSQIKEKIQQQLIDNPIILYMKGVPSAPECGFSAKASQILNATKVPYTYVNVLKAPFIREKLPSISKWPTYPQLFVQGELVGVAVDVGGGGVLVGVEVDVGGTGVRGAPKEEAAG